MKTNKQIADAKELNKKVQDYIVLAQAETKLKKDENKEQVCNILDELTTEIKEIAKTL